jgi:ribosomal protein S18 acetylase RimI-like enzyme
LRLNADILAPYLDFVFPADTPVERAERHARWLAQVAAGERCFDDYFAARVADGRVRAALHVQRFHEGAFFIPLPAPNLKDATVSPEHVATLLSEALVRLRELGASRAEFRLTETAHLAPLSVRLPELGFRAGHARIEFEAPVTSLPSDEGSPLTWHAVSGSGPWTLEAATRILERAGVGDPDWNADDDNSGLLKSYLDDRDFASTLDCVQLGLIGDEPAAIVVAQVIPTDGWSRITYMGVLPEFRGRGFGAWVHRHGFAMMRAQGGKHYQGGTVRGNARMVALFRRHGCQELRTMQEWAADLGERS